MVRSFLLCLPLTFHVFSDKWRNADLADCITSKILLRALTFAVDAPFSYWLYSRSIDKAAKVIYSKAVTSHTPCLRYCQSCLLLKYWWVTFLQQVQQQWTAAVQFRSRPFSSTANGLTPFFQTQRVPRGKDTPFGFLSQGCADCMLTNSVISVHPITFIPIAA